ncbi:MAG: hypothetical protein LJF04_19155 [Gemmatimonadetes bacterium]|nr:hypothetical protein [Gemmatimonadota bacterium]
MGLLAKMLDPGVGASGVGTPVPMLDAPSAVEFMREALIKITEDDIARIAREVEAKRERMVPRLSTAALERAGEEDLLELLAEPFATRRRRREILTAVGQDTLREAVVDLLHGTGAENGVARRFTAWDAALEALHAPVRRELGGELLRMLYPERYWLWARWMWNPATDTGALPLVLVGDYDLHGDNAGATYMKVGKATRAVLALADELGFSRMRANPFAVDVYLGGVYGVYLYTVTRLRMTQEFNRVIPKLPELLRRMFGVHHREG